MGARNLGTLIGHLWSIRCLILRGRAGPKQKPALRAACWIAECVR